MKSCENCTHIYKTPSWVMRCATCDRIETSEMSEGFGGSLLEWAQLCARAGHDVALRKIGA